MGKQGSPKSPRPNDLNANLSSGAKDFQFRYLEKQQSGDLSIGRRNSGGECQWNKVILFHGLRSNSAKFGSFKGGDAAKRQTWVHKHLPSVVFTFGLLGFLFLLDSLMFSIFHPPIVQNSSAPIKSTPTKDSRIAYNNEEKTPVQMYERIINLASSALAERELKQDRSKFWKEQYPQASVWKPCADKKASKRKTKNSTGFILVSANGGLNQQRVAITDADIAKEATPSEYVEKILPLLLHNGVVHFLGYGNRLGFDPLPFELQKLRCKCNFHALKFVPKIQEAGSLLIRRIRKYNVKRNMLDEQLLGNFMPNVPLTGHNTKKGPSKYLALHLRFEVDMVAYSLCEFGGGETERRELQAYRELHFPLLIERLKNSMYVLCSVALNARTLCFRDGYIVSSKAFIIVQATYHFMFINLFSFVLAINFRPVSPEELRRSGKCPLTPEEAALVLAGLGFKHKTYIYLAGSSIYGGQSRMKTLTTLYPNLITKEDLLQPNELAPFKNFSSQLAALDFIACATSDVFAITDSGSQLSSLVSGFRTYYGGGHAPTLKPVKKKLAAILSKNKTIEWNVFEEKVRKMIEDGQKVRVRGIGRSIYRHPRCPQCMCKSY
ncbi:hypothetical protein LguiB_004870 [Lonicera macranthoides]